MTLSEKIQSLTDQEIATNFDLIRSVKYRKELLYPKYRSIDGLFDCIDGLFIEQRSLIREELSKEIIKRYKQTMK